MPGSSAPQRSCRSRATSRTGIRRLHLVSIPYDQRLQDLYLPSEFTSDEYPNLIPPGEKVDTVAARILLAVFNWPEKSERYQKVARFVDALFSRIDEFAKPPRHPKWKEASVSFAQDARQFTCTGTMIEPSAMSQSPETVVLTLGPGQKIALNSYLEDH